ncbi:MAG: hypothetical protein NTU62_05910 [Spirochaetes bacterium]|nr:hypothetical protein [Spirochaetota bacterium]
MPEISRMVTLRNEVEASIMKAELERRGIPHVIRSFHDSAYDGLYQMQKGWGVIEADEEHRREIEEVYEDLRQQRSS